MEVLRSDWSRAIAANYTAAAATADPLTTALGQEQNPYLCRDLSHSGQILNATVGTLFGILY